jgi:hypothetical protein
MRRVSWTHQEQQLLLDASARAISEGYVGTRLRAINQAQLEVLPENRRRKLAAITQLPWFEDGLKEALERRRKLETELERPQEADPPPAPTPSPGRLQEALQGFFQALRDEVLEEVQSILEARLGEALTMVPKKQTKTSVLIVGLKGGQMEEIKRDFDGKFDLRFIGSAENKHQLRAMVTAANVTLGVTNFMNHAGESIIKDRSARYIPVDGGITRLKDALRGL